MKRIRIYIRSIGKAAEEDLIVFSGGAKGVDTTSETTALINNGYVVSILADSLERKIIVPDIPLFA